MNWLVRFDKDKLRVSLQEPLDHCTLTFLRLCTFNNTHLNPSLLEIRITSHVLRENFNQDNIFITVELCYNTYSVYRKIKTKYTDNESIIQKVLSLRRCRTDMYEILEIMDNQTTRKHINDLLNKVYKKTISIMNLFNETSDIKYV